MKRRAPTQDDHLPEIASIRPARRRFGKPGRLLQRAGRRMAVLAGIAALPGTGLAFDHAAAIASLDEVDLAAGQKIYVENCATCHGIDGDSPANPLARSFATDSLKYGADPYSLWKTVSYGNGMMFPWDAVLSERERYQVVHYIREAFLRKNGDQYTAPDAAYLAGLAPRAEADARAHAGTVEQVEIAAGMLDGRMGAQMRYGPAQSYSVILQADSPISSGAIRYEGTTERALVVALPGEAVACYDQARLSVSGLWAHRLVNADQTHHTSYKGKHAFTPGEAPGYINVDDDGWQAGDAPVAGTVKFKGRYLREDQVVLTYAVNGRDILELPGALEDRPVYTRTFSVEPGGQPLLCLVGRLAGAGFAMENGMATLAADSRKLWAASSGDAAGLEFRPDARGGLWLAIPASATSRCFTLWYGFDQPIDPLAHPAPPNPRTLTEGGARRWPQPLKTPVVTREAIDGYAVDELRTPLANPWGSWMRLTALDFFADGRIAVSTLSGDVWIVTMDPSEPDGVSWSRFANGLYEPLGLRIVDDIVYVRCRDAIVRLQDLNDDGEADYYENFFNEPGELGAGYHAFIFELQTDRAGNFYYAKSSRKSPHKGGVARVSPDGSRYDIIAGDLRSPNGMGAGGPDDWVTIADNPHGKAVYNGFTLVREGASYGYQHPRNIPMLVTLPPTVDSSSTGQCWSDPDRWGPLSGSIVHTSYSGCSAFYVMVQNVKPFPNGFAVRLPFAFPTGLMRSRANPIDGQVYTVGLKGWDTPATADGGLYRIRYTGESARLIKQVRATSTGLEVTFTCDLDPASVKLESVKALHEEEDPAASRPAKFDRVSLVSPRVIELAWPQITGELLEHRVTRDARTGAVSVGIRPPLVIDIAVESADGAPIRQTVYATINALP